MRLYNSRTRKVDVINNPHNNERVNLFVCGPTVYDHSHIGHGRTFIVYDGLVHFLRKHLGWNVFYLQNITDIDDRIIEHAQKKEVSAREIAKTFEEEYYEDMTALRIDTVDTYARATDYIPQIIAQVESLLKKKNAYTIEGEGIYFDITTFADYGKLSGRTVQAAEEARTSRIDESVNKRNKGDFALWKFTQKEEPNWDAPFGAGRPGWHIEDTAIAYHHFGFTYDMHGGAIELKFPHHEAEIAQMESLSGVSPMVNVWVHSGVLNINGEKMAKSKRNYITIREFLSKHTPQVLRMFVFSSHYRSPVDYSEKDLKDATAKVKKLNEFRSRLAEITTTQASPFPYQIFIDAFWGALKDDFNTPKALAELFNLVKETNKLIDNHTLSKTDAQGLLAFMVDVDAIFKLLPSEKVNVPEKIVSLVARREEARAEENFEEADRLREKIEKKGFYIKDTGSGPRISEKD